MKIDGPWAQPGTYVWVLVDDSPHDEGEETFSLVGAFSSRENALDWLRDQVIGEDRFARIQWEVSSHNRHYFEGRGDWYGQEYLYHLIGVVIDELHGGVVVDEPYG